MLITSITPGVLMTLTAVSVIQHGIFSWIASKLCPWQQFENLRFWLYATPWEILFLSCTFNSPSIYTRLGYILIDNYLLYYFDHSLEVDMFYLFTLGQFHVGKKWAIAGVNWQVWNTYSITNSCTCDLLFVTCDGWLCDRVVLLLLHWRLW